MYWDAATLNLKKWNGGGWDYRSWDSADPKKIKLEMKKQPDVYHEQIYAWSVRNN